MLDLFELPVEYEGKEFLYPAELMPMGFTHKIKVTVDGIEIVFEPDEEMNYRAMISDLEKFNQTHINKLLLLEICKTLDLLFGNGDHSSNTVQ